MIANTTSVPAGRREIPWQQWPLLWARLQSCHVSERSHADARGGGADLCHHASNAAKIGGSAIKAGAERTARTVSDLCSNKISPSRQWYGGSRTIGSEGTDGHELESGVHSSRMPASHPASTNEKSSAPEESLPSRLERNPAGRISVRSLTSSPLPS
jgi:hypothetical protein